MALIKIYLLRFNALHVMNKISYYFVMIKRLLLVDFLCLHMIDSVKQLKG